MSPTKPQHISGEFVITDDDNGDSHFPFHPLRSQAITTMSERVEVQVRTRLRAGSRAPRGSHGQIPGAREGSGTSP
ncbi:hypothetical protein QC764_606905 [Podospora pseudoanserina]|uniref:Uncharacterized protein n=1 Tax=Podospora pseudoanserina TaxID=2609844 RepID=A0ABR0HTX3_9PEZI|nr:hypothetical protein QC764_606905 [Podospora pseudoanserina]